MNVLSQLTRTFPDGLCGLIFDCDGVLVDSRDANVSYYNLLLEKLGKPPLTRAQEEYAQMATAQQAVEQVMTADELAQLPALCARYPYSTVTLPLLRAEPGLVDLVNDLRQRGVHMAIHTNRGKGMWDVLRLIDLLDVFDPVMTVDKVEPKPHPEGVLRILEQWQAKPGTVGFIGDSLTDAGAAAAAKVPLLSFRNPSLTASVHVQTFKELQTALHAFLRAG